MSDAKKILVSLENESPFSMKVLNCAAEFAEKLGGRLVVLSIVPYSPYHTSMDGMASEDLIRQALEKVRSEVEVSAKKIIEGDARLKSLVATSIVVIGDVADKILEIADKENVQMIVVGKNCSGAECRILGSAAFGLVQRSRTPIVVIPSDEE